RQTPHGGPPRLPPYGPGSPRLRGPGFIGVWNIDDNGDVPPRALIQGPMSRLIAPGGVALNPKRGEVFAVDGGSSAYYTYIVPQFFNPQWLGAITSRFSDNKPHRHPP